MNVCFTHRGSHSAHKGNSTLCTYGFTVVQPIDYICLCSTWSMGNMKSNYLCHEVVGNQHCGLVVTGINPITSCFMRCVFLIYEEMGDHIKFYTIDIISHEHYSSNAMFIITIICLVLFISIAVSYFKTCILHIVFVVSLVL